MRLNWNRIDQQGIDYCAVYQACEMSYFSSKVNVFCTSFIFTLTIFRDTATLSIQQRTIGKFNGKQTSYESILEKKNYPFNINWKNKDADFKNKILNLLATIESEYLIPEEDNK